MSRTGLALRSLFFALLIPGTNTVLIPLWLARSHLHELTEPWSLVRFAGLLPFAAGAFIMIRCIWDFTTLGKGTLAPVDPPTTLVVRGLYRYVRNPMYVGALIMLIGEAMILGSPRVLAWAAIWFTFINGMVVFYEERTLQRRFGDSYEQYRRAVGRWIPRVSPRPPSTKSGDARNPSTDPASSRGGRTPS